LQSTSSPSQARYARLHRASTKAPLTSRAQNELPEYYEHIKLPIALDTIEDKLESGGYTNLAQVESDCKRLVNNAKAYNDKRSIIYEDAERLRKTASNWMVKHNPAYRDGNYIAVATPVPGEENSTPSKPTPRIATTPRIAHSPAVSESVERPRRAAAQVATPLPSKLRQSASAAPEVEDNPDFDGKTFQQAQEQIVREIIDYVEPEYVLVDIVKLHSLTCAQERPRHIRAIPQSADAKSQRLLPAYQGPHVLDVREEEGPGRSWTRATHGPYPLQELGRARECHDPHMEERAGLQRGW
jgi:hypothetical protein